MTAPSGIQYGVGVDHVRIYELDETGLIKAVTGATPYIGLHVVGGKTVDWPIAEPRKVGHVGDKRLLAQTQLPSIEPSAATMQFARNDYDVHAVVTGTMVRTLGNSKVIGHATSRQGQEPKLCWWAIQQTQDDNEVINYRSHVFPSAKATERPSSFNDNANEYTFSIMPGVVKQYPWGDPFDEDVEGFTSAMMVELDSFQWPLVCVWQADGQLADFTFPTDYQAADADSVYAVSVDGVLDASATIATSKVTPSSKPADKAIVRAYYGVLTLDVVTAPES